MATDKSKATIVAPKSGFRTPQFWLGLVAVLLTFILGTNNITLPSNLVEFLQKAYQNNLVPGIILTALVAGFIAFSFFVETLLVRNGRTPSSTSTAPAKGKPFYRTSEFWLGLVTIILNYAETSPEVQKYITIRPSAGITTLLIALVYTFARAQLKQAYANAELETEVQKIEAGEDAKTKSK